MRFAVLFGATIAATDTGAAFAAGNMVMAAFLSVTTIAAAYSVYKMN